jgi:hypothetical protein
MGDPMVARVSAAAGVPDLVERLATSVSAGDLEAFLLELARRRATPRLPQALLAQHLRDRAVRADSADARQLARLTLAAFEATDRFEALELSPVEPLGAQAVLGGLSQDNVLSTVRASEVVADPTVALALSAAAARRAGVEDVRLCACMRVVRPQSMARRHFRLFALVSAGRSTADHGRDVEALVDHVAAHLAIGVAARDLGAAADRFLVRISDAAVHATLTDERVAVRPDVDHPREAMPPTAVRTLGRRLRRLELAVEALAPVVSVVPDARLLVDLTRSQAVGYYNGLQLRIDVVSRGVERELADGGTVDWAAQLLSDRRERLFTSGLGLERLLWS